MSVTIVLMLFWEQVTKYRGNALSGLGVHWLCRDTAEFLCINGVKARGRQTPIHQSPVPFSTQQDPVLEPGKPLMEMGAEAQR